MAENIPQLPFANERQPTPQPNQKFTAEDIRSRMNAINGYLNTNRPAVLSGIAQGQADQAELISKYKTYMNQGTSDVPKVQNLISGDAMTGPNPGLKGLDLPTMDYVDALMSKSKLDVATKADPYFFARPTSFNASKYGLNYDRFYSHPKFKELGFSIYRDNEALYNAKSTWLDDFRRMGSKWLGLAWQGGSGMFKNWGQFGAFGEAEDAAQMEHDLSVAMSSKGGAGAWTTNFLANSAYTVGIIGEIAAEEAVLWGATALTGGATSPLAALRTTQNMASLGKSMKVMAQTLGKADKSRLFWKAAQSAGAKLLPTETLNIGAQALDANSAYNRLSGMAKATKTFGAFYRDMREINAVTAESRLEGGFVQNKVANDALAAFIKENNRMPNTDEARVISDKAFAAGKATMLLNVPAIYLSNKLVLGTALKGFSPIRRLMNKEALSSNIFKTVSNYGWKAAGKKPMELVEKGLINSAKRTFSKDYLKAIPSRLKGTFSAKGARVALGGGIRYFSANLAEGLQESYQEAIQSGATDYYLNDYFADLYKDPYLAAKNSLGASIMKGMGEQFSMQGLDVFAQGFLMGGVIGGAQNIIMPGAQRGIMKIEDFAKGTNKYGEYIESERKRLQAYADAVNSYTENPALYAHWLDENVAIQRDLAERYQLAEETGNREEAENVKDDSLFNHVHTLLQTGKFDGFVGQLEDLRDLSDTELEEAFGKYDSKSEQNKKSPRQKLETAIKKAKDVQDRFDRINEKFKNPYNPDLFDKERDKEAYNAEQLGYRAFETAKKSIAFNEYTFDRTLSRLKSLINNAAANGPLGNVAASDFAALYTSELAFNSHEQMLKAEIEALGMGTTQDKALSKKKSTQLNNLQELRAIQKEFKMALLLIEKAKLSGTEAQAEVQQLVKDMAKSFAKEMKIVRSEDIVDPVTGQVTMDFNRDYEAEEIADDVIINEFYKEKLYDAYSEYVKNIADVNDTMPILSNIENSFGDLVDFVKLDAQAKHMSEYANMLADPMAIFNMSVRVKNALETVNARRKELHLEALTDYKENIQDVNDLLEKLFGIGVYFDPDSIEAFRKDGKLPDIFLSATDGSVIDKNNPKYQEIVDLIAEEEILRGKTFSNKPVAPPKPPAPAAPTAPVTSTQPPPPAEEPEEVVETTYDVTTPISELPAEMQTKLREAHAEAMLSGATSDIQEWMLESPEAATIVTGVAPVKKGETKKPTPTATTGTLISAANPKSMAGPTPDLQPIYDILARAGWKLSEDQTRYVSTDGQEAFRVSDLKEGKPEVTEAMKAATGRGNILDIILREFASPVAGPDKLSFKDLVINNYINGDPPAVIKARIEKNFLEAQFKNGLAQKYGHTVDEGFVSDMANVLYDLATRFQHYTWHTSLPTMVGKLVGKNYGGTIDLLLEKNGKYFIIDLKTSVKSRRTKEELYDKNDQIQQNAYAELFEQLTGKPISGIYILNLLTKTTADRKLQAVQLDMHKNEKGQDTVLNALPRVSVAELKGYKPETPKEGDDIASFFGNIGNQGLAVMEADMLKTGKHTISGISKATPEQRKKIDSDIEELKKKYPEKNITSKVENDNLIVESGVTAPVSDIEAKKADIERRRQEELLKTAGFFTDSLQRRNGEVRGYMYEGSNGRIVINKTKDDTWNLYAAPWRRTKEGNIVVGLLDPGNLASAGIKDVDTFLAKKEKGLSQKDAVDMAIALRESFLNESAKDYTSINAKYDAELAALEAPVAGKKAKKPGITVVGSKLLFTGTARHYKSSNPIELENVPVEVIEDRGYVLSDDWAAHIVVLKRLDTNEEIKVDLEADYASRNKVRPLTDEEITRLEKPTTETIPVSGIEVKKANIDNLFSINSQSILDNKKDIIANPSKYETSKKVGNITIEQTVDVAKSGALTIMQFVKSNDKAIYLSNRIYVSSKGEVSSRVKRGGGIGFFKDESGVVTNESKERMLKLAETVKNYFPEIFARIEEYAKKHKGFVIETTKFGETFKKSEFIDAFDSFLHDKDLLSDADFVRITLHNAELAALEAAEPATPVISQDFTETPKEKPVKAAVPSRFAGKVIWAQPGTVNPEIFEKFDVVNADDIAAEIAARRGITPEEGKTIHQTIQNQPSNVRADIQNQVKAEIEMLKGQGKTIITSNWYMQGNALVDITSSPAEKEAVFMGRGMSPEESVKAFNEWIGQNQRRAEDYLATQEADWVSQQMSGKTLIERNTQATVQQLFEREQVRSTPLRSITNAGNSQYLIDSITAYMYNPEIRGSYTIKDANGVERVLTPEEVVELAKKRARRLMDKEEFNTFSQEINNMMAKEVTPTQPTVSQEDKSSAQDAIKDATSASDTSATTAADIYAGAINKSNKEVDNDFDKSLGCK